MDSDFGKELDQLESQLTILNIEGVSSCMIIHTLDTKFDIVDCVNCDNGMVDMGWDERVEVIECPVCGGYGWNWELVEVAVWDDEVISNIFI